MTFDDDVIYGPCSICGAVDTGRWPHPLGESCPQKVLVDDAYVAMLDAQRMSYIRSAGSAEEMAQAIRRATGDEIDDAD